MPILPADVQIGDVIQTRKAHPCGSDQWRVYRIGADTGLCCLGCDRRVMLPYREFARAMKKVIRSVALNPATLPIDPTATGTGHA